MQLIAKLPLPHTIAIGGLSLLLALGGFTIPNPLIFLGHIALIGGVGTIAHLIWKRSLKWDIFAKDTLISLLIIALILVPATSIIECVVNTCVVALSVFGRAVIRFKGMPIFNPAAFAVFVAAIFALLGGKIFAPMTSFAPFDGWWGTNFAIEGIMVGTIISVLLGICIVLKLQKWHYALSFFVIFSVAAVLVKDLSFAQKMLTDGTIYFLFAVMACEPRTAPIHRNHQIIAGAILGVCVLGSMIIHFIPSGLSLALLITNLGVFAMKRGVLKRFGI